MKYMEINNLKIKELEALLRENPTQELIAALQQDDRASARKLAEKYQRQQEKRQAEQQRLLAMYKYEDQIASQGYKFVAGVDEAGRGPLAGPVSVAAVILPKHLLLPRLNDSKKLTAKVRDELYDEIMERALAVRQVFVFPEEIDRVNILQATMEGMCQAVQQLSTKAEYVLIDAVKLSKLPLPQLSLIKGDAKSASIAAASIIAKVSRDRLMEEYDRQYPQYGFAAHKGYGTAEHIAAIKKYGPCPIHRLTFEPVKTISAQWASRMK